MATIVVVTDTGFPNGFGATSRILSYSRGLIELGHQVCVICYRPSETPGNELNTQAKGVYGDICYYYSGAMIRRNNRILRAFNIGSGILNILPLVKRLTKEKKIHTIILASNSAIVTLYLFLITRSFKIKYILEKSEFPFFLGRNSFRGKLAEIIYAKCLFKLFDGIFCMTHALKDYFETRLAIKSKIIVIPMTVETERFILPVAECRVKGDYLAYCGDMGSNKDGLHDLITAFSIVHEKYPDIRLLLIGDSSNQDEYQGMVARIESLQLSGAIVLTGKAKREEMPAYLVNAKGLLLARPDNLQARGGFPTKLGEYLATGKPVVVTAVGEIPVYLKNNENAYLCEPGDPKQFAEKIMELLADEARAGEIGRRGKALAQGAFDYKIQAGNLETFIMEI